MEYYRYFQYSQDEEFLKSWTLQFLREVVRFYIHYLKRGENGIYNVPKRNPYEFHGNYHFRECVSDLAHIRWLLPALIEADARSHSVSELSTRARDVLDQLAPFMPVLIRPGWLENVSTVAVTVRCQYHPDATAGLRFHVRGSADVTDYDTTDLGPLRMTSQQEKSDEGLYRSTPGQHS